MIFDRISGLSQTARKAVLNWLDIVPASEQNITLVENSTFITDILKARVWYRGDADELFQFFRQLNRCGAKSGFWESVPTGEQIRKIHSGLPAIIVDTCLTCGQTSYIVKSDMDEIQTTDASEWGEISESLDFENLVGKAIVETLVDGDGAFKISVDSDLSPYPLVEFVGADRVEFEQSRGIVTAVIFKTPYECRSKRYILSERYGKGFVESCLTDEKGNEYPLDTIPETEDFCSRIEFDGDYIMAVPLRFFDSKKYPNRGKSIFGGGKSDCFDALDRLTCGQTVISQWWDALRDGRVKQYIPESMIPRNPE